MGLGGQGSGLLGCGAGGQSTGGGTPASPQGHKT